MLTQFILDLFQVFTRRSAWRAKKHRNMAKDFVSMTLKKCL